MNKRYMDFVPAKKAASAGSRRVVGGTTQGDNAARAMRGKASTQKPVGSGALGVESDNFVPRQTTVRKEVRRVVREAPEVVREEVLVQEDVLDVNADTFSLKNEPEYGVIEDYRPKFVKTEVEKRPLSRSHFRNVQKNEYEIRNVENLDSLSKDAAEKAVLKVPKSPFINHGKVAKRPLSKNVYEKKIEPTKEEPKGPLTIIEKPDENQKSGVVVTIILTILLGAVAGTIAFLLLPK